MTDKERARAAGQMAGFLAILAQVLTLIAVASWVMFSLVNDPRWAARWELALIMMGLLAIFYELRAIRFALMSDQ